MANIASALKSEIARIARKQVRGEIQDLRKASAQYRVYIASLRRRIEELERELKRAKKGATPQRGRQRLHQRTRTAFTGASVPPASPRRERSWACPLPTGTLIGVTGQSIYKWEAGQARPRAKQLELIAAVRGIGKREAAERLELLRVAA